MISSKGVAMQRAEYGLAVAAVVAGFAGAGLIGFLLIALMLLEGPRFNPAGTLILTALVISCIAIRFFALRHLAGQSAADLLGLSLAIVSLLSIFVLTIASVGFLLLPAVLSSIGLLAVATVNQIRRDPVTG